MTAVKLNLLRGSWLLKFAALIFAVLSYLYIHHEIDAASRKVNDPSYKLIKLTAKNLPLKVRFATAPPEGYRLVEEEVVATPSKLTVVGPEALLIDANTVETALVDISETTRTTTKKIPVESVAGVHLAGEPTVIEVIVPIKKIGEEKKAE